ncbi:hypothetical protein AGOR_G00111760 [Albula goreensis]|uniref:Transcription factor Adf-1 n=1 Tax=Albula goreensis TaxID=1534307 RepID=A0A8T3DHM6_9TELE|nr:hypothetical protein AGOR_G00111760 [Albula goreensis]
MEERLITAVSIHPELYNSTLSSYKDLDKKAAAWRAVSLQVELPEEDCRKKWKSLRDGFIKDKRSEERRLASGGTHRCWKYSRHMAFLTPFIQSRTSAASSATDDLCDGRDWEGEGEGEANSHSAAMLHGREAELSDTDTPPGFPHSGSPALKRTRWQGEGLEGTEDELFLMSLLPHLKRLPYEKKCAVKLKFHQLLYEAEFHKVCE